MKTIKHLFKKAPLFIVIFLFMACGGSDGSSDDVAKVKPEKIEISGELEDYLQIVDGEYEIVDDWGGTLSIKVKAIKPFTNDLSNKSIDLFASVLNEKGLPVSGTRKFEFISYKKDDFRNILKAGEGETVIELKDVIGYKAEKHANKTKQFSVSSIIREQKSSSKSANDASTEQNATSNNTGGEDYDKMLDDYEEYVDSYIKFYRKSLEGDQAALAEYPVLMEKATKFSISIQNAQSKNQLSPDQVGRMAKIQVKMMEAIK